MITEPQTLTVDQDTLSPVDTIEGCSFPGCKYPHDRGGYCVHHAKHYAGPKPEKKPVPIAKESKKRAKLNRQYRKQVGKDLESDPQCHVHSPECTGYAEGMNHKQKRSPKNLTKLSNLTPSCNACNGYIEKYPQWAKENGHQVSKFKKLEDIPLFLTEDQLESLPEELYIEGDIKQMDITINNIKIYPTHSLKVRKHAESFMWGFPGLGSLQLALAILLDYLPEEQALHLYKRFELNVVDSWPFTTFEITLNLRDEVRKIILKK